MRRIIPIIIFCSLVITLAGVLIVPSVATAVEGEQDLGKIETRLQVPIPLLTTEAGNITVTPRTLAEYIIRIYNFLLMAATVLATVMLVWGGFMWMTAGGGAERVGKAQEYIWNAIAGLVILFGAYLILSIVNPDLTTLKSLKINPIKPLAQGFFCDERIQNLQNIYSNKQQTPPTIKFIPIQTSDDKYAMDPSKQRQRVDDVGVLRCGTAYAIEQVTQRPGVATTKAIEPGACFGRLCNIDPRTGNRRIGYVCDPNSDNAGKPGCILGAFAGNVYHEKNRGVDYIKVLQYDTTGYDNTVLFRDENPGSSSYWVPMVPQQMAWINDDELYYLQIELEEGGLESDDLYYVGKGSQRIKLDDDNNCGVVTNAKPLRGQLVDCEDVLWTGAEIKQGIAMDLRVHDSAIFEEDTGECSVSGSIFRKVVFTFVPGAAFFVSPLCD